MREQGGKLTVIGPDGFVFRSGDELRVLLEERTVAERAARSGAEAARAEAASAKREMRVAKAQTEAAKAQTEAAKAQTEAAKAQVAVANERAERLAAKLRELGIEPE
jgi:chromosome segregation ATPase